MNSLIKNRKGIFAFNHLGNLSTCKYAGTYFGGSNKTRKSKEGKYFRYRLVEHCQQNFMRVSTSYDHHHNLHLHRRYFHSKSFHPIAANLNVEYHSKYLLNSPKCLEINPLHSNFFQQQYRSISLTHGLYDQPSSKIETTVQSIKNKTKEIESKKESLHSAEVASSQQGEKLVQASAVKKKSLKTKIWEELVHYYHGFRLLVIDINICRKIMWELMKGKKLTRREHRLLVRTTADLFRLLPFSVFIIVPFLEFLLPVFIKLFPGMLPSTFQTAKDREDKLKQSLQVKLEVAKFLQKTLDEMAVHNKEHKSEEAKEFSEFFRKIRNPNETVKSEEIIKFSKHFEDEITLESLSREQLMALSRTLELRSIGTTNFLKFQIRMRLRSLIADDKVIHREGVDSLNLYELQQACKARGMRAYGLSEEQLRNQLQEWIDLSLNEKVPPVLLLLSRALMVSEDTSTTDKLKVTMAVLPDDCLNQTKAAIGEKEGKIDNKIRIDIIKKEQQKIKEEKEEEARREKEKIEEKSEILVDKAPIVNTTAAAEEVAPMPNAAMSKNILPTPEASVSTETEISSQDVQVLGEALKTLAKEKLIIEKETIKDLKEEIEEYKEDVEELKEVTASSPVNEKAPKETKAAKALCKKVNKMIEQLDTVLENLGEKEKSIRQKIGDVASSDEKDQLVRIDELMLAIQKLQKVSDGSRIETIERVLSTIDTDKDGRLKVDDVLKVIEAIGKENVKLREEQIRELIELFDKEETLEAEEKIEKALAKSLKEKKSEELKDTAKPLVDKATDLNVSEQGINKKQQSSATKMDSEFISPGLSSSAVSSTSTDTEPIRKDEKQPIDKVISPSRPTSIKTEIPPPPISGPATPKQPTKNDVL